MKTTYKKLSSLYQLLMQEMGNRTDLPEMTVITIAENAKKIDDKLMEIQESITKVSGYSDMERELKEKWTYFCERNNIKGKLDEHQQRSWNVTLEGVNKRYPEVMLEKEKIENTEFDISLKTFDTVKGFSVLSYMTLKEFFAK